MPDGVVQIFISYAHDDDAVPPGMAAAKGFVSFLYEQLTFEFKGYGKPRPTVWRDVRRVSNAEPFDAPIQQAVEESAILVVVLSDNWLSSDYCRRELDMFAKRWGHEGELALRRRIIRIGKRQVDDGDLPSLLQGQVGINFHASSDHDEVSLPHEFYARGNVRDERCYERLGSLAGHLIRLAARQGTQAPTPPPPPRPASLPPPPNGRTIYVAQPGNDMREGYTRVVTELAQRGFTVVPEPDHEIPHDTSAVDFIDAHMARAELSVHLLGTKSGYAPEDIAQIVPLQLQRAAARARGDGRALEFRRIVWAPKIFGMIGEQPGYEIERDPLAVLERFDRQLDADKVTGENLSQFVSFLTQHLVRIAPPTEAPARPPADGMRIYLNHAPADTDYAAKVADALYEHKQVEATITEHDGSEVELNDFHRRNLLDCDAVALCWANASAVSVRALASQLRDYHALGRTQQFVYRSVVAGPPGERKIPLRQRFPRSEIDFIVNATDTLDLSDDMLDQLVSNRVVEAI